MQIVRFHAERAAALLQSAKAVSGTRVAPVDSRAEELWRIIRVQFSASSLDARTRDRSDRSTCVGVLQRGQSLAGNRANGPGKCPQKELPLSLDKICSRFLPPSNTAIKSDRTLWRLFPFEGHVIRSPFTERQLCGRPPCEEKAPGGATVIGASSVAVGAWPSQAHKSLRIERRVLTSVNLLLRQQ